MQIGHKLGLASVLILACSAHVGAQSPGREVVGVYSGWAAFRDREPPRCYAIATPELPTGADAWASVSAWPTRDVRGELHFRLSRMPRPGSAAILSVDDKPFALVTRGRDAWAATREGERAAIVAMRRGLDMRVRSRDEGGRAFTNAYRLAGAASAIDAMLIACAGPRAASR